MGHFTCQRFLQFLKTKPGKRSVALARKVMEKKHASSKKYLQHGRVFHLFSRNLYEALAGKMSLSGVCQRPKALDNMMFTFFRCYLP